MNAYWLAVFANMQNIVNILFFSLPIIILALTFYIYERGDSFIPPVIITCISVLVLSAVLVAFVPSAKQIQKYQTQTMESKK